MNEWSECCNAPALYFKLEGEFYDEGTLEAWDFCSKCLECASYYEANEPKEVDDETDNN